MRLIREIPSWVWAVMLLAALAALAFVLVARRENRRFRRAERSALSDPVTGLANRLGLEHRLATEWERAVRYGRPLGLLVLDLDGFKRVNDTRGHAAGDELLQKAGAAIAGRIRRSDLAARTGGDEFVVVAAETSHEGLGALAASLRQALAALAVEVSIGFAERTGEDESAAQLLHRADLAMYEDKECRRRSDGNERVPIRQGALAS